jgi:hypothetical protein
MKKGRPISEYTRIGDVYVYMPDYWARQLPATESGCIPWSGAHHPQGYPMMNIIREGERKMGTVHRITAMLKEGRALLPNEAVVHTCSRADCLNPDHLIIGDLYTRNRIMAENGRSPEYLGRGRIKKRKTE